MIITSRQVFSEDFLFDRIDFFPPTDTFNIYCAALNLEETFTPLTNPNIVILYNDDFDNCHEVVEDGYETVGQYYLFCFKDSSLEPQFNQQFKVRQCNSEPELYDSVNCTDAVDSFLLVVDW